MVPIAAVLAGGSGSRIGGSKATVQLAGRPLIEYPLRALEEAGLDPVVVAKRETPLPALSVPVWLEGDEPHHPARGIATALERSRSDAVVVVGCDMPFLTGELLAHLAALSDPLVVASGGGRLHPLLGRYARALAPAFTAAGDRPLHAVVAELGPRLLDEAELSRFGDPARLLFNVNTMADLERASKMLD